MVGLLVCFEKSFKIFLELHSRNIFDKDFSRKENMALRPGSITVNLGTNLQGLKQVDRPIVVHWNTGGP